MADAFDLQSALQKYKTKDTDLKYPELVLLYSSPGSGKTHTALTASELPGVKKMLYLDTEGSTVGVASNFDLDKIDIIRVDQQDDPIAFINTIVKHLREKATGYEVAAIDTLDVLQDMYVKQLKNSGLDGWELWREVADWTMDVAEALKSFPGLGIIVIHDKTDQDDTGKVSTLLRLSGAAKDLLPGKADLVAYLERKLDKEDKEVHTFAHLEVTDRKVTKNKFHFPPYVRDVSLPGLWKFIDNYNTEKGASK